MFVDEAKVKTIGGRGGDGCASFRREKFQPRGGPDGGNGGDGGNVIFRASHDEQSLLRLHYEPLHRGGKGEKGGGKNQHGAKGADVVVPVPQGTVIRTVETQEIVADLKSSGDEFVAARGGEGGWGNKHFATSTRQAPREAEPGSAGEENEYFFELKTIADVGLVGYPNAGKSSLLSAVSHAHPKTAAYPFTSLQPTVGIIEFDDFSRLSMADIPGLIEGAHENVGLGDAFLRHIERASVLVYVLDVAGSDNRNPWDDYFSLQRELEWYKDGLSSRPSMVVANKMDLPGAEKNYKVLAERIGDIRPFPMSVLKESNISKFLGKVRDLVNSLETDKVGNESEEPGELR